MGATCGKRLARWGGYHWVLSRCRSVGGHLDFEQRKPHKPWQVGRTSKQFSCDIGHCNGLALLVSPPWVLSQEGVNLGMYSPMEVSVETDKGQILCRTYQMNNFHACPPSPQYKQVCAHKFSKHGCKDNSLYLNSHAEQLSFSASLSVHSVLGGVPGCRAERPPCGVPQETGGHSDQQLQRPLNPRPNSYPCEITVQYKYSLTQRSI